MEIAIKVHREDLILQQARECLIVVRIDVEAHLALIREVNEATPQLEVNVKDEEMIPMRDMGTVINRETATLHRREAT